MATTAVQFRRGTETQNNNFTGAEGEVVVDLTWRTVRVHDGEQKGGFALAREDMTNVSTSALASGHNDSLPTGGNLLYANLSNLPDKFNAPGIVKDVLIRNVGMAINDGTNINTNDLANRLDGDEYGKALSYRDMSNVDTANLATAGAGHKGKDLSYADMSNVDTANLATAGKGHKGKNLAYTDMTNVDTAKLATSAGHSGKNLAYTDMSNIDTANLATAGAGHSGKDLSYADMSNVDTVNLATAGKGHKGDHLAYANMKNVNTSSLGTSAGHSGKNLAYTDLSNLASNTTNAAAVGKILTDDYDIAYLNMSNVDTANLATTGAGHSGKNLSYADMSNVDTTNLATTGAGHAGKNLAYADMTNVDTTKLGTSAGHAGKNLAYTDMSNINTTILASGRNGTDGNKNLAYADMTNVDTTKLGTSAGHSGKNLAYTDMSNINTNILASGRSGTEGNKNLAYADLSNLATWSINQNSDISSSSTATQIATKKAVYDFADDKLAFKDSDFASPVTASNKGATMAEVGKLSFNQLGTTITNANLIDVGFSVVSSTTSSTNFPSNVAADWLFVVGQADNTGNKSQVAFCITNPKIQMVRSYISSSKTWTAWEYTYGQWYAG